MNTIKYKTVLCKHFGQNGTCSYGDKCQFAHGFQELKSTVNVGGINQMSSDPTKPKVAANPSNFKIVKCKNWETTGSCKYGSVCTFAHGDNELRSKSDNNQQLGIKPTNTLGFDPMTMQNPMMMYQDPNYVYNLMMQQQMMMSGMGGMDVNSMNMGMGMNVGGMNNVGYVNPDINLNDPNNMFYMGLPQQQQQIPHQGMGMYEMNYNPYGGYDKMGMQPNNLNNMYMGGPYNS
jgi:hypothetical protein